MILLSFTGGLFIGATFGVLMASMCFMGRRPADEVHDTDPIEVLLL